MGRQNWGVYMIVFGEGMHNCSRNRKKRWFHDVVSAAKERKSKQKRWQHKPNKGAFGKMRKVFMPKAIYVLYGCMCIITFPSTGDQMTKEKASTISILVS
jgi:hypothetical protein